VRAFLFLEVKMLVYNANGATSGVVPVDSNTYNPGDSAIILTNSGSLFHDGSVFVGWNTAADGSGTNYRPGDSITMAAADLVLYAEWSVAENVSPTDIEVSVKQIGSDNILSLTDLTTQSFFAGYEIERKVSTGDWQDWSGSAWGGVASAIMMNRFSDYDVLPGLYQYRVRARLEVVTGSIGYSDWYESDWVRIAGPAQTGKIGWSFANYSIPEGEFGEVLAADDLRYTFLWGVPFTSSRGEEFTDDQIRFHINSAVREFELALNLTILKRKIVCQDDYVEGSQYDEFEDPYAYHRHHWNAGGRINLRRRPIISVEDISLWTITGQKIIDLKDWLRVDHSKGVVHFYPKSGPAGVMRVSPAFLSTNYLATRDYPHAYRVSYTAGYASAAKVPPELREIIGKAAACKLLNIIGDGLISGFASSSLSMDGLSESISTTQSATNAYYGARIGVYLKDIEAFIKANRNKYKTLTLGSI
jgi:hypothetical protein